MKSKPVKVWVVWQWHRGRWVPMWHEWTRKEARLTARREYAAWRSPVYRITSGTVMPPGVKP